MSTETNPRTSVHGGGLPLGVYLLAHCLFSMGSAEFLLAGVLPAVAEDLQIALASAGGLITAFAIGVASAALRLLSSACGGRGEQHS